RGFSDISTINAHAFRLRFDQYRIAAFGSSHLPDCGPPSRLTAAILKEASARSRMLAHTRPTRAPSWCPLDFYRSELVLARRLNPVSGCQAIAGLPVLGSCKSSDY